MKNNQSIVIRFSGDSGDGMQLTGTQFTNTSALMGNDTATFPDFPAEIRAPQGTVAGVSGFQVHFGKVEIFTPGDTPDVLVAMNPAALVANIKDLEKGSTIIVNEDAFTEQNYFKAGLGKETVLDDLLSSHRLIKAPISSLTKTALEQLELDTKSKLRCKNFFALGMTYYMFNRDMEATLSWIKNKFKSNQVLVEANSIALKAGYNYADTIEVIGETYKVDAAQIEKGTYRQISGNQALAWGFMLGAEKANRELFLGSYPITPASDVLHELSKHKSHGVKTFQAEDEIAAICSAIGASYAGDLAITTSSGPGIALKGEALGLAVIYELPLVVINIQRGGPSTGLPTKTEQSDLNLAMNGRNGESPLVVLAASTPSDCFHMAYEASRIAMEHMTPVVLLSDGYLANGSGPWKIPDIDKVYPKIKAPIITKTGDEKFLPYKRDEKLVRSWALPGTTGLAHRLGGLEKQVETGNVSYDPHNHEKMVEIRAQKVAKVVDSIPKQEITGDDSGDLLVISWGGTYGTIHTAVKESINEGVNVSHMHLRYLNPLPSNLSSIFTNFKSLCVCELNSGQLKRHLQSSFDFYFEGYSKVQGQPFKVREIKSYIEKVISSQNEQ
jgi:2-oxoglutarate ferredoxin oxidoreductase subunit alpha